ncbi:MAG: SDR family oxidoreductase [Bradyrhizobium sp.]|nr:SDR family oxidoreductase [Bradyrhizobium sp.]
MTRPTTSCLTPIASSLRMICGSTESDDAVAFHKSQALDGRLTEVQDIAPLVRFLVTEGSWITGQTLFANGGYTTR